MSQPIPVSAVICTRNRPDLIGTAVSSVLANTYPSFDLLVVDQSTDARAVCLELRCRSTPVAYV